MVFGLMKDSINVSGFKEALLRRDLGLSALPDQLRREMLGPIPPNVLSAEDVAPVREESVMTE